MHVHSAMGQENNLADIGGALLLFGDCFVAGQSWITSALLFFIEVYLIYSVVLSSAVQQSDSVIYIYIYIYIYILLSVLFHYTLSQDIEYSSLCYTVGPCCLSNLYILICIC